MTPVNQKHSIQHLLYIWKVGLLTDYNSFLFPPVPPPPEKLYILHREHWKWISKNFLYNMSGEE